MSADGHCGSFCRSLHHYCIHSDIGGQQDKPQYPEQSTLFDTLWPACLFYTFSAINHFRVSCRKCPLLGSEVPCADPYITTVPMMIYVANKMNHSTQSKLNYLTHLEVCFIILLHFWVSWRSVHYWALWFLGPTPTSLRCPWWQRWSTGCATALSADYTIWHTFMCRFSYTSPPINHLVNCRTCWTLRALFLIPTSLLCPISTLANR